MERTGVLNGSGESGSGLAVVEVGCSNGSEAECGSSALSLLEAACETLRSVSLEGLDEDELCRVTRPWSAG